MRPFEGFKRKAVIVVNGEEEQARRQALQEATEGKEVPDSTLLEMKAAMVLPEVGDWLEEIVYVGATEEEAKEIIKTYNAAGKAAGYGSERRFSKDRWNYNRRNDYRGGRNFQRQGGGGYNRQPYPQNRWGGAPRQGGGGSGGGWKQDTRSRDWRSGGSSSGGGYERRDRDYYSQGSYGGRSQQQSRPHGGGQRWGGSSGGGWSGQGSGGGGWNQQTFSGGGGGGSRNYGQGGWGGQSGGQGGWGGKYGSSGSGGGGQGQGGYGYNNWNYYGQQQQQNWSGQK
ncbi:unnamed protein product [Psylliodes chrysocephalus]|uniref:Uncharacterized protein n=1 Tax=Psylliodes chrysocephalus TaxID=3402493 RepID=A0A9P0CE81_9CUCU|nr:unnamed protein product [Psylliodes chrysocephala]